MDANLLSRDQTEMAMAVVLTVWTLGSVIFVFPRTRLRRALGRFNHGLWFANWAVFGTGRERSEISLYVLEFRDHQDGRSTAWVEVFAGRPWRWHAFLWQPGRRIADRFHRMAQDMAFAVEQGPPIPAWLEEDRRQLIAFLAANWPQQGAVREIRVRRRRSMVDGRIRLATTGKPGAQIEDQVLLVFSAHGSA